MNGAMRLIAFVVQIIGAAAVGVTIGAAVVLSVLAVGFLLVVGWTWLTA